MRVPAKVNLHLAVGSLRWDGYHELVTVFQALSMTDEVTIAATDEPGVQVYGEGAGTVPTDHRNLAWRAVLLLAEHVGRRPAVRVVLRKTIPVAGGMAGGSERQLLAAMGRMFASVLRHRSFLAHLGIVITTFVGLYAWVSGSSILIQGIYGLSPLAFGATYAIGSSGYLIGTNIAVRVVMRHGLDRMIGILERQHQQMRGAVAGAGQRCLVGVDQAAVGGIEAGLRDATHGFGALQEILEADRGAGTEGRLRLQAHPGL